MLRRFLVTALLACALAACGDDDGTGPDDGTLTGRYTLITVGGDSLPLTLQGDSSTLTWVSGFYNLNTDDTFTYGLSFTVVQGGATRPENDAGIGFWSENKGAVFFEYADGSRPDAATIVGRNMYMTLGLFALVFRRE